MVYLISAGVQVRGKANLHLLELHFEVVMVEQLVSGDEAAIELQSFLAYLQECPAYMERDRSTTSWFTIPYTFRS